MIRRAMRPKRDSTSTMVSFRSEIRQCIRPADVAAKVKDEENPRRDIVLLASRRRCRTDHASRASALLGETLPPRERSGDAE